MMLDVGKMSVMHGKRFHSGAAPLPHGRYRLPSRQLMSSCHSLGFESQFPHSLMSSCHVMWGTLVSLECFQETCSAFVM
jgi:hypothetical protein